MEYLLLMSANLLQAAAFAAEKHRAQRREDSAGTPYINHPLAVATVLAVEGGVTNESLLVAALLHDTVEDTQTTFAEIEAAFGAEVARLVAEVTDDKSLPKATRKQLQIEHAAQASQLAKQLKIADKICNVRDMAADYPTDWAPERKAEYLDWAERVVAGCRGVNDRLDALFEVTLARSRAELGIQG
jgi:guanosine-3',5'-bis(diphosphate) 3'-pyrophosphohydrolase